MHPLSPQELERALKNLADWRHVEGVLTTTFGFETFLEAIDFVGLIAEMSEKRNHYPSILIEKEHVTIELGHEGEVTDADIGFAHAVEELELDYDVEPDYAEL